MRRLLAKSKTTRGPACRRSPAAPPFVRGRHLPFFAETKAAERPRRSGRPVCGLLPLRPHPRLPLPAAAQRRRGQRRVCRFFLTEKIFSPGLLTFVRHKGLSYSQQKNPAHRRTDFARPPPCMQAANTRRSPSRSAAREKGVSTKNRICLWAYYHLPKGQMQAILALNETEERQEDKRK